MKSNTTHSTKKNKVATSEVGAPTTNRYPNGGGKKQVNSKPAPVVDKS